VTDDISVGSGVTLTVEPGVIVKFRGNECDHNTGLFVNGTLLARGTETDRIYFTSLLDDSAGGDVNGDGGATTPAAGDWTRIEFSGSGADNSVIEYTVIRYAGHWKGGGSCWTHYYYGAIHALGASPAISRTMFIENQNGVWAELLANPTIHYCKIQGNVDYGVRNDDSNVLIDATYNWWGDSQGPTTETYTTPDSDKASNYVDYDPWLPQSPFAPTVLGTSANEVTNDLDNTVIVTGTKFLPTPAVKLGSMPMGGVTWITATRISFVIPVGFPTGTYALTIVNPDGESTTAPNAMTVRGTESYIYLPVVLRNHQ